MYQYIYDTFTGDRKYRREIAEMENRLTDLGLMGRVERLTLFKDVRETLEEGVRRGVKTVVAVGNDETVRTILGALPSLSITVGLIPFGESQHLSRLLGIPRGIAACDILSARLIQKLDIGKINGALFLTSVSIPGGKLTLACEDQFSVRTPGGAVRIWNLPVPVEGGAPQWNSNPCDGFMETVIESSGLSLFGSGRKQISVVPARKIMISARESFQIFVDGVKSRCNSAAVEVLPQKLKVIVGKGRRF